MGLYNLQNICKILTPLFTLASSIDIHNLKSSFDPKHLWNHRISLSMGRKKKKRKSEASWVISFLILENSQDFLFSFRPKREEKLYANTRFEIFLLFSRLLNYIYLSFIPRRRIFLLKRFALPLLRSILLAFKTARNFYSRDTGSRKNRTLVRRVREFSADAFLPSCDQTRRLGIESSREPARNYAFLPPASRSFRPGIFERGIEVSFNKSRHSERIGN